MFLWFDIHRTNILYGWMIILPDIESLGYPTYRLSNMPIARFVDSLSNGPFVMQVMATKPQAFTM